MLVKLVRIDILRVPRLSSLLENYRVSPQIVSPLIAHRKRNGERMKTRRTQRVIRQRHFYLDTQNERIVFWQNREEIATYLSYGCYEAERENIFLAKFREARKGCERGYGAAV